MAEKKVKIRLPLVKGDQENNAEYVAVNGRSFLIKRGVTVEVPACVAEVLQHSEDMQVEAMEYESATKKN